MRTGIFQKKNLPELLFGGIFLLFAFRLNLQFLDGANINWSISGHDEYLTIREVYSILEPASIKNWILAIIGGDILYYGRVVFYSDALVAWLPYKIWGISGMVMAIRMAHCLWILTAVFILGKTFIKTPSARIFWYWGSGALTYTLYFMAVPKPEPIQLLFIALFFKGLAAAGNPTFGKHYFWLGLAFAAKFNIIIILPFLFLIPLLSNSLIKGLGLIRAGFGALAYFLGGFFAGIPCLLLSPVKPVYLQTYLKETFMGTGKAYDDSNIGFLNWFHHGLGQEYLYAPWAAYLFGAVLLFTLFDASIKVLQTKTVNIGWISGISGILLMTSIMILTKRLWPHYLWTGYILCWFSLIYLGHENWTIHSFKRWSIVAIIFIGCIIPANGFFVGTAPSYLLREKKPLIQEASLSADSLYNYLGKTYHGKRIGVDWSIKYPYKYFVKAYPYQGKLTPPGPTDENQIKWYSDYQELIWDESDVVVFQKYFPPILVKTPTPPGKSVSHDSLYRLFIQKTTASHHAKASFKLDTIINGNYIFNRQ